MMVEDRGRVWAQTLLVSAGYTAAIVLLDRRLFGALQRPLALALSFSIVQVTAIALMLVVLLTRRGVAKRRAVRSLRISESAANAIAQHAAGNDRLRVLRELGSESRRDVERALASFLAGTRGTMHERVTVLARDLGVHRRGVLERNETRTLFDRALLADETRGRALELAGSEIPRALASGDTASMIAALDLLRAWRVALSVENFEHALGDASAEVRARAWLAAPYVRPGEQTGVSALHVPQTLLSAGLSDPSPHVRAAAAQAAGKLRSTEAVPRLETLLFEPDHEVAVAAAFALAMTEKGLAVLHRHVAKGHRVAFEALEKATMGLA